MSTVIELLYIVLLFISVYAASVPQRNVKFTLSSLLESALPAIHPIMEAGSNKCEAFKSFLGLTYEQMQGKNSNNFQEVLNIDLITKNGSIKFNLTSVKRLTKVMESAQTVIILIHGFMESSDGLMVKALAPEFLKQSGLRILALDGRKLINLEYFRSSTQARFMGEQLGTMISETTNKGVDPSKIVLIGHSLGAHIAGVAGKQVRLLTEMQVGRIVALDPAGPCFSSADADSRLDRSDAAYVDVIHTNSGMLGLKEPVGHKDFYPNGGLSQPGCYLYTCDHSRVWELFAEAINAPNNFPARKCYNWTMFREGLCSKNEVSYLGMNSKTGSGGRGSYFLTTAPSVPYGLGPAGSG